jgi:ubiquinone/menaquinone biosynthesis C-methylase UbiE
MAPTTDSTGAVAGFYDRLSPDYDAMTGFEQRFERERPFFKELVDRHHLRSAIDAGTGTGFHALLLAQLGVEVTAVDLSSNMIASLVRHAKDLGITLRTLVAGFSDLPRLIDTPVDAVLTLGNTLAHIMTPEELQEAMVSFAAVLKPEGILFAQLLNYRRILASRETLLNVKEVNGKRYSRSYAYPGGRIRFTITREDLTGQSETVVESVDLNPVLDDELVTAAHAAGFGQVRLFGGVNMEAYVPGTSRDLVILCSTHPGGVRSASRV